MEKAGVFSKDNFFDTWNVEFPNYQIKAEDLKIPQMVIGALLQAFDRVGIDRDSILAPPPEEERNESTTYYWDLLPVINITRVFKHLFSMMSPVDVTISITHFLQPMTSTSKHILMVLLNLIVFYEQRFSNIAPYEEELFGKTEQVKTLEDKKNNLLQMLNEQAQEKGNRAERMIQLDDDIKKIEEELKQEKELHAKEKQQLDALQKENHQTEKLLEQKKSHLDALIAENERKRALRVYDADDIKSQAEQAALGVQEADEKLNSLRATLMQKENSLKNLQTIKPSLDTGNNLLHEMMKLSESLKDFECGDLESNSKEGELEMLNTELLELRAAAAELRGARADRAETHARARAAAQRDTAAAESALREAEEKDRKCRERCERTEQRIEEIKRQIRQYEQDKAKGFEAIANMKETFYSEFKSVENTLLSKMMELEKIVKSNVQK